MADKIKVTVDQIKDLVLPDGFELKIVKTKVEKVKVFQDQIDELSGMPEPSIEELTEYGRMSHPYYELLRQVEILNEQIEMLG